ncbi:MAG: SUF system NifU family Fe-S cluster assembly protein [Burkholderiales bacterium]|nr:SUF system NifU family Fe-S cluster assembly protein [Burkholderiales bacterium]
MPPSKLYDDVILDHIRNARNYHVPAQPHVTGEAINPLCGDTFQVHVVLDGERIVEVGFQCECCGISMASASIMTGWVRNRTRAEALQIRRTFIEAVSARSVEPIAQGPSDHTAVLQVVQASPARDGCAMLAWTALETALTACEAPQSV